MASWSFKNIGSSCNINNRLLVKQLLESCNVDLKQVHGSECGEINLCEFKPKIKGEMTNNEISPLEIYQIANDLFDNISIYYEIEEGNNTSDDYYRYEEIYDSSSKKILIGEKDYSYGSNTVFGESPYKLLKDEIEKEANKKNISISWDEDWTGEICPDEDNEKFYDLCEKVLDKHGTLSGMSTKKSSKKIEKIEINQSKLQTIVDKAGELGYKELVELLEKKYLIKANNINNGVVVSEQLYSEEEIQEAFRNLSNYYSQYYTNNIYDLSIPSVRVPQEEKYTIQAEKLKKGDKVILEHADKIEGLNMNDETLAIKFNGNIIGYDYIPGMAILLDSKRIKVDAYIDDVLPLSQRSKHCKIPLIDIRFTYEIIDKKN